MAEFKITRFRYTWKGDWSSTPELYYKDDVVYHSGSAWVCIRQHVPDFFNDAQTYTAAGDTLPSPAWVKSVDGREWQGDWSASEIYEAGVLVLSGGNVYLCVSSHTSTVNFSDDLINWELFATGLNFRDTWDSSTRYKVGDVVRYGSYTYVCYVEHTSSSTLAENSWNTIVENYTYVGTWDQSYTYRKNDLVKYGGSILKCTVEHTSASSIDSTSFETYLPGFKYHGAWDGAEYYAIGDVVTKGGTLYVASENNYNSEPGISDNFSMPNGAWNLIDKASRFAGDYDPQAGAVYKQGDLVRRGGALWRSITDQFPDTDSSLEIFDVSNWELVIAGYILRGPWHENEYYNPYDLVFYRGSLYYCNTPNISSMDSFPGDNGEGYEYWTLVVEGDTNAALTYVGDLITYNLNRNVIYDGSTVKTIGDGSTVGTTQVPIGANDQLLVVENAEGDIGYKVWGNAQRIFYVRTNGVDDDIDPNRGINYFKPWRSIRFALDHADDGYDGTTLVYVSTGEYIEILPMIVPAGTAVLGEELRGTSIVAGSPIAALASDAVYTLDSLLRLGTLLNNLILNLDIVPSDGNTELQVKSDITSSDSAAAATTANTWANIIATIDYKVNGEGSIPISYGTNTALEAANIINAIQILEDNREFIKAEAVAYTTSQNPELSFDTEKCKRDISKFIDALQYDLEYPGNYKTILAGKYYANAVIGSQLEDMFYVRNSTGLRNLTLKGLVGTLPDLVEGEQYRLPTGGAFVSLDPGWGPDDERVWITTRSCYIQNVTTFGTAAVGQKIDGLLHNGGNRSIVSNDFTQVISDGIGAWATNGGRAELVSVFTYYAHIGMFAKDGGILRATNGNSSYGDFGAVAEGVDPNEVVNYGYLNTRTEQAQVYSAFAGEILDYILGLEFQNFGQGYSTATYSITSSGVGATAIQEEFRDNAMFECQTLTSGSGFSQYGNQAQLGGTTSIVLATSENIDEVDILGMRVIIISGVGTGQYGYVSSYNPATRLLAVKRETDDQPGWDHILPGTPASTLLTSGSRYRIEPRITFSAPAYSATEVITTAFETAALIYGETSQTFIGVSGTLGAGEVIGGAPAAATFTVEKINRSYEVSLTTGGAGYAIGDIITISGADVGGTSGEHDITLTVVTTTDDSTNSILTFTADTTNIATSGGFVATPLTGHFGRFSIDGATWTATVLPESGAANWKCLASGDNKFVAISSGSSIAASSTNGIDWVTRAMPASRDWNGVVYGKPSTSDTGIFVAVSGNLNAGAYSINGTSWTSTTLPDGNDSTLNEYVDIAFGYDRFVALANSNNSVAVGTYDSLTNEIAWAWHILDVIDDSSSKDWVSIAYGNRRFVAIANTGEVAYSFDGENWLPTEMPTQDGSTLHNWKQIRYGQGVFIAVGDTGSRDIAADPTTGPTTYIVTSYDGVVWTPREAATEEQWGFAAFGNPDTSLGDSTVSNSSPMWVIAPSVSSTKLNIIRTGARALGRAVVSGIGISYVKLWDPGSGYTNDDSIVVSVVNPGKTAEPTFRTRTADGVLAQPTFVEKGVAYKTSTTTVTITGDGFADVTPRTKFLTVDGLVRVPGPGAQFYIKGRTTYYVAVQVGLDEIILADGSYRSTFQVSPTPDLDDYFEDGMEVVIRELYSQVRITGHDFLDVGSGNFIETNYPQLYTDYLYEKSPLQETFNLNGGRVFYTSTDQDGNFRAGDQFAVEQATGIITISADFFDLAGLTELRLAGVRVGSTAIIREFSKDPLFLQNSNNSIPTQRAVRSYLQSRLNIGGEDLLTPSITAGTVKVGPNLIDNTAGLAINVPVLADFYGAGAGISGSILAQTLFFRSFRF